MKIKISKIMIISKIVKRLNIEIIQPQMKVVIALQIIKRKLFPSNHMMRFTLEFVR